MEKITTRRSVKYTFTEIELLEMSAELAHRNQELRQLEDQKKSVVSDFGSRINVTKEVISQVSDKIASGYEMRDMEFVVSYHKPEKNMKTLFNEETGVEKVEKMALADFDLFSQFVEEEEKNEEESSFDLETPDQLPEISESNQPTPEEIAEVEALMNYEAEKEKEAIIMAHSIAEQSAKRRGRPKKETVTD